MMGQVAGAAQDVEIEFVGAVIVLAVDPFAANEVGRQGGIGAVRVDQVHARRGAECRTNCQFVRAN
jgi:hypothetical protein